MSVSIRNVAVVGLGVIGASWAAQFLEAGLRVSCFDPSPDAAGRLDAFLTEALSDPSTWRARLHLAKSIDEAVRGAELVQENGPEAPAAKAALIEAIDAAASASTLIASSTSGHRPSDLQAMARRHPGRVLVAHPLHPPHLIPLLELVPGRLTSDSTLSQARRFYESIGKKLVVPANERTGHVANRLQAALLREAFALVIDGTLDARDIDVVVTHGLALRWACAGPFALTELGGGAGGSAAMLRRLGPALDGWWQDLSTLRLDDKAIDAVLDAIAHHPTSACTEEQADELAAKMTRYRAFCRQSR